MGRYLPATSRLGPLQSPKTVGERSHNNIGQLYVTKSRIQALTTNVLDILASVLFDNKEHIATFTLIRGSVKSTQKQHYSTFPQISLRKTLHKRSDR